MTKITQQKVVKLRIDCGKYIEKVLVRLANMKGTEAVQFDSENNLITVYGNEDPVYTTLKIRKYGFTELLAVGPFKARSAQFNFAPASDHTSFASSSTSGSTTPFGADSSTSKSTIGSYVYDVFISNRGPDTKKGFASFLYNSLIKYGYRVFLDSHEMKEGENLKPQIEGAIRTASVHIAIFSPRFAESEWCLNELILMLESRLQSRSTILPVFYDVLPSDLRWARGENKMYGLALSNLAQKKTFDSQTNQEKLRYDPKTIENWRDALSKVAEISGFVLKDCNGDQGQLAKKVVQKVLEKVSKTPLSVAKYPIGVDDKVQDFERTVLLHQQSEETRVIGIVGLGGVGKSTLAKEIFNRLLSKYKKSCCLLDVREKSLISLQTKLLKDLAQLNKLDKQIDDVDGGITEIKNHLRSSSDPLNLDPLLLILDDVDHVVQLDALLVPVKETLQSGSLILITSRKKDVLINSGIEESSIYMQTGLNQQNSRELFCMHAFNQGNPVKGFEQLVENFLSACDGLPLSLQVLGALLRGQDLQYWDAQLRKLSEIIPEDIENRLRISYDSLDGEEKQIFLDIACFFIGEDRDTAIRIWDGCGWHGWLGLRTLENRCLVDVDSKNRIKMHDHLRDMGRRISEDEPHREGLRLWHQSNNGPLSENPFVRGISMVGEYGHKWSEQSFENHSGITNMSRLQLLRAEGDCAKSIFRAGQSPQLTWLSWYDSVCSFLPSRIPVQSINRLGHSPQLRWLCWYNCPYSFVPSWIPVQDLRVLQIKGRKLKTLWQDKSQVPLRLRELNIEACRLKITKSIGKLNHLQKFVLCGFKYRRAVMETLPEEFCHLLSLEHVEIRNSKLKSLPRSFGKLTKLKCVHLSGCSNLQTLPDSFGDLTNLQCIHLSLSKLQMFPNSFGNLENLQHISLSECSMLQMLPESFGNFRNLQDIDLSWCKKLKTLPDSFGNLKMLQHIDLWGCFDLQRLPDIFANLTNLRHIDLSGCLSLEKGEPMEASEEATEESTHSEAARIYRRTNKDCPLEEKYPISLVNLIRAQSQT